MAVINWALYTEPNVGRGHPSLADVVNRPLRQVLTLSGLDPDGDFGTGFARRGGDATVPFAAAALTLAGALTLPLGGGSGVVAVGAPDSGGAGFRLLRVPN